MSQHYFAKYESPNIVIVPTVLQSFQSKKPPNLLGSENMNYTLTKTKPEENNTLQVTAVPTDSKDMKVGKKIEVTANDNTPNPTMNFVNNNAKVKEDYNSKGKNIKMPSSWASSYMQSIGQNIKPIKLNLLDSKNKTMQSDGAGPSQNNGNLILLHKNSTAKEICKTDPYKDQPMKNKNNTKNRFDEFNKTNKIIEVKRSSGKSPEKKNIFHIGNFIKSSTKNTSKNFEIDMNKSKKVENKMRNDKYVGKRSRSMNEPATKRPDNKKPKPDRGNTKMNKELKDTISRKRQYSPVSSEYSDTDFETKRSRSNKTISKDKIKSVVKRREKHRNVKPNSFENNKLKPKLSNRDTFDLRSKLGGRNRKRSMNNDDNREYMPIEPRRENLLITINQNPENKPKPASKPKYKKVRLTIEVMCESDNNSDNESGRSGDDVAAPGNVDLSFLDDLNIDEIVDSLKHSHKSDNPCQQVIKQCSQICTGKLLNTVTQTMASLREKTPEIERVEPNSLNINFRTHENADLKEYLWNNGERAYSNNNVSLNQCGTSTQLIELTNIKKEVIENVHDVSMENKHESRNNNVDNYQIDELVPSKENCVKETETYIKQEPAEPIIDATPNFILSTSNDIFSQSKVKNHRQISVDVHKNSIEQNDGLKEKQDGANNLNLGTVDSDGTYKIVNNDTNVTTQTDIAEGAPKQSEPTNTTPNISTTAPSQVEEIIQLLKSIRAITENDNSVDPQGERIKSVSTNKSPIDNNTITTTENTKISNTDCISYEKPKSSDQQICEGENLKIISPTKEKNTRNSNTTTEITKLSSKAIKNNEKSLSSMVENKICENRKLISPNKSKPGIKPIKANVTTKTNNGKPKTSGTDGKICEKPKSTSPNKVQSERMTSNCNKTKEKTKVNNTTTINGSKTKSEGAKGQTREKSKHISPNKVKPKSKTNNAKFDENLKTNTETSNEKAKISNTTNMIPEKSSSIGAIVQIPEKLKPNTTNKVQGTTNDSNATAISNKKPKSRNVHSRNEVSAEKKKNNTNTIRDLTKLSNTTTIINEKPTPKTISTDQVTQENKPSKTNITKIINNASIINDENPKSSDAQSNILEKLKPISRNKGQDITQIWGQDNKTINNKTLKSSHDQGKVSEINKPNSRNDSLEKKKISSNSIRETNLNKTTTIINEATNSSVTERPISEKSRSVNPNETPENQIPKTNIVKGKNIIHTSKVNNEKAEPSDVQGNISELRKDIAPNKIKPEDKASNTNITKEITKLSNTNTINNEKPKSDKPKPILSNESNTEKKIACTILDTKPITTEKTEAGGAETKISEKSKLVSSNNVRQDNTSNNLGSAKVINEKPKSSGFQDIICEKPKPIPDKNRPENHASNTNIIKESTNISPPKITHNHPNTVNTLDKISAIEQPTLDTSKKGNPLDNTKTLSTRTPENSNPQNKGSEKSKTESKATEPEVIKMTKWAKLPYTPKEIREQTITNAVRTENSSTPIETNNKAPSKAQDKHIEVNDKEIDMKKIDSKMKPPNSKLDIINDKPLIATIEDRMLTYFHVNYKITSLITHGKYSQVLKCMDAKGKPYALKVINEASNRIRLGINKEKLLKELYRDIPKEKCYIVQLINGFGIGRYWGFLMEYFPTNLHTVLYKHRQNGFHINEVQSIARQLVSAVMILRNNNVIHSNIRPTHILMNESTMTLKLCGFDESFYYGDCNDILPNMGSLYYRAPEIILGFPAAFSIDVWSLGVTLYEIAVRAKPFFNRNNVCNNGMLYEQMSTFGRLPCDMIQMSAFKDNHFVKERFMWNRISIIQNIRIRVDFHKKLFSKYWKDHHTNKNNRDTYKLSMLENLLRKMFVLDPRQRLTIEFVYADPFIYEMFI